MKCNSFLPSSVVLFLDRATGSSMDVLQVFPPVSLLSLAVEGFDRMTVIIPYSTGMDTGRVAPVLVHCNLISIRYR
jgi:hypothetical protein